MGYHSSYALTEFSGNHDFGEVASDGTPIFLLDMDGVLVDLEGAMYDTWTERYPNEPLIPKVDRREFYMDIEHPATYHDRMRDMLCEPGFFRVPEPVPGAVVAAHHLLDYGEVFICTSPMWSNPTCADDKVWWVDRYLGPDWKNRIVITKDKTTVRGTVLFDDRPVVEGRLKPTWEHVVFGQPYNAHVEGVRVEDWLDAEDWVNTNFEQFPSRKASE